MDHLQEMIDTYSDSTVITPSCGAKTVYVVLDLFDKELPDLSLLEYAINSDQATKESSLLDIQGHLESNSLYTLPVHASLKQVDKQFDSYVSIIHTVSRDQNIQQETPNHFEVLIKTGNSYYLIDPPNTEKYEISKENPIQQVEAEIGYAKTMLLVSDRPIQISDSHDLFWIGGLVLLIAIVFKFWLKKIRNI